MFNTFTFLSYALVMMTTPGPINIMSMINASKYGYKKNISFSLGVTLGALVLLLACTFFNILLINILPKIQVVLGILGAIYMIYLAIKIFKSKPNNNANNKESFSSFFTGFGMQFINPKGIIFDITVTSNFIIPYFKSTIDIVLIILFLVCLVFIIINLWGLFGVFFNKFFGKYNKQVNIVMGLLLIYCAISISGINQFF